MSKSVQSFLQAGAISLLTCSVSKQLEFNLHTKIRQQMYILKQQKLRTAEFDVQTNYSNNSVQKPMST